MPKFLIAVLFLCGCATSLIPPENFNYKEIQTKNFKIASWQKITDPRAVYKIYIEGDGYAFTSQGQATQDPTPKGHLVRELAFGDANPNVIYLSRPCQYLKSGICSQRHWTTARFAPEIVTAEYEAIKAIAGENPVILVGFSGGAQIAGLVSTAKTGLNIKKVITIGGNLDHLAWTQYHKLPMLNESMNLESYKAQFLYIPQVHYVGSQDKVIPPVLVRNFVGEAYPIIEVKEATHNDGWEEIYQQIWNEQ